MKRLFTILVLFFVLASTVLAQMVDPMSPLKNDPAVRYGKLDNGLTYYIRHNAKPAQRADFYFVANVGAIQESKAQDGLAHFQEHMALNGTKNLPGKMMLEYFQKVGVEFGRDINAGTGVEQTMYMLKNVPVTRQGIIDTALLILHDYCGFVTNDPKEVEKERGVIVEEWRTRRVASWRMHEKELPYLYGDSKYAECTLIGDKHNLETFDPSEIVKFYQTWYRPDLEAVVIVGDIDVDAIEKQIIRDFADLPVPENPTPKVMPTIPDNEEPVVGIITDPEAQSTSISFLVKADPLPAQYKPMGVAYLTDLINDVVFSMVNERLDDISKQPNAPFIYAVTGYGPIARTKDALQGQLTTKEGEGIQGFSAVMTEMERIKRFGFTDAEFERAKTNILRGLERAKDNAESRYNADFIEPLTSHFLYDGQPYMTPEYEYDLAKGYLSIIPLAQLNQVVGQLFTFGKNTVIIYKSIEKEGLVHPTEGQFTAALAAVAASDIQAPVEESVNEPLIDPALTLKGSPVKKTKEGPYGSIEWTLKNGTKVIVKPTEFNKEQVLMSIENAGGRSLVETEDIPSIENNFFQIYTSLSGISKFPATKLTKMLTGKVVSLTPFIGSDIHGVNGSCSPKDIETMLQLAYLSYTDPRFVESEFQPGLDQIKAVLPNLVKTPNYALQSELMKVVYNNNPRTQSLSLEMLDKFNFKTLEKVCKTLFSNTAGAIITIVGNVNPEEIKPLVEKYIGSLPMAKKPSKYNDRGEYIVKGVVNHPFEVEMATPKTSAFLLYSGKMPYTAENEIKMNALTYILDMVYTESIREEEGGSYGVTTIGNLSNRPSEECMLQIVFDTDPEKAEKLILLAKEGLAKIVEEGPSQDFLNKAKENALKNIPDNRISNGYWNRNIRDFLRDGRDMDTNYEAIVNSLTVEGIREFTKGIVGQGNFVTIQMNPKK